MLTGEDMNKITIEFLRSRIFISTKWNAHPLSWAFKGSNKNAKLGSSKNHLNLVYKSYKTENHLRDVVVTQVRYFQKFDIPKDVRELKLSNILDTPWYVKISVWNIWDSVLLVQNHDRSW